MTSSVWQLLQMSSTTTTMLKQRTTTSTKLPPSSVPQQQSQQQSNGISYIPSGNTNLTKPVKSLPSQRVYKKPNYSILWPSRFLNAIFGPRIYKLILYCTWIFWFVCGVFVLRKTGKATKAVYYVKEHAHTVSLSSIEESDRFKELVNVLDKDFTRPPAILLLNQYALNMTFNFLCNTAVYPGVHERLVFVTLDSKARDVLAENWPNIRQLYWPTPSLYKPFSFAEGPYQLIYLLRSNLAVALIRKNISFWMMQQDTFWRQSLFDLKLEDEPGFDALFDQIGDDEDSLRAEWVNGANFFIKANNKTLLFFERVSAKLEHYYTPDMGIMIHQCHTWGGNPMCRFISHKIAHSWEWMYTNQTNPPLIMQLDCETDGGSKLQELAKFGFYFTEKDGRTCNPEAVKAAQRRMIDGKIEIGHVSWLNLSWGRFQFRVYWWIVDCILWFPILGSYAYSYLPLVGYILMFTM